MPVTLSQFKNGKIALGDEASTPPVLARVSINNSTGAVTYGSGDDIALTNVAGNTVSGSFIAGKVWNAVWNDIADFQSLADELIPGKCYFDTKEGAKICDEYCKMSVIGIASDTFGQALGVNSDGKQVPIAVAGWVLAYVDKEYPPGTPLTSAADGSLTEISMKEKRDYPERIIALYKKPETEEMYGPSDSQIKVDGRHWVKVR